MAGSMELDLDEDEEEPLWWQENGYLAGKDVGGGWWVCLAEMAYTYRVMLCTPLYVGEHYCYPKDDFDLALKAWIIWDGKNGEEVPDGYTRHH